MEYGTIKGFEHYEVYEDGTVWRKEYITINGSHLKRMQIFPYKAKNKYLVVALTDRFGRQKKFYLHRLVWEAFNGEIPKGLEISHEDCDKSNCKLENLQLRSHSANCRNPESIRRYKAANALCHGKFNRELMEAAKSKENKQRLKREYMAMLTQKSAVGVWEFMKSARCNYYTALKIIGEMNERMGVS